MANVDTTMHNHHPAPDDETSPPAAASSSDGTNQPMVVDRSPEGGANTNDGTMAAADANTLLPLPDKFDDCTVLNGKCIFAEGRGRYIHGNWALSTPEYNNGDIQPFEFDSVAKTDEFFSTKGAKFVGRFVNDSSLVVDEFTIRPISSSDNCTYFEGTGQNELYECSYNIYGKLSGKHLTMVRFPPDSAIAMDDGELDDGDGDECWAPPPDNDAEAHLTEERPSPTKVTLGHTISLKGQLQILDGPDGEVVAKLQGMWAEYYHMLENVYACQSFIYESKTAPPHEGEYVGTFSSTEVGGELQCRDSFSLLFIENSDGYYNLEGQGYNDLAGHYHVSGTMNGDDIIMQRRYIVVNDEGTKRVQSVAELPSTAEAKEPGKGSKRRKKGKDGGTTTDKSGGNIISKVTNKAKKAAAKVVAKLSSKPDISQCTLVDPPAELVVKYAPWLDQAVKVFCPIAHPKKATTACKLVKDMKWVCVFCMQEKKDISKQSVQKHFQRKHLEEYNKLCALEKQPKAPGTLVDPPAELVAKYAPWLDQAVKVFCPIAHPKKATTACTQVKDMKWVCVLCMQEKKDISKQTVQKHFQRKHLEEYNKLVALEASTQQPKAPGTLVDPPAELVARYAPWLNPVKVFCPIAHPKKAIAACKHVSDMVWVCVFCMQEKKKITKQALQKHFQRKHLEEYNKLCALESAIQQQQPSEPDISQCTLVDPPAELVTRYAPWLDQAVKVFCPIAHPKKAIAACKHVTDMVWVCVYCMQQKKGLMKRIVQNHLRSMHLEEYNKLCPLQDSTEATSNEAVLVDVISSDRLLQEHFQIYPVKSHPKFEELAYCTLCECNCPLDGIHEHVSRCHPEVWDNFQAEVRSNEQPLLSSVTVEETDDNTNINVAHCINALPPRHQEVYNEMLGEGMTHVATAWDELFKSDKNTKEEYLKDIGQSGDGGDQSQSDSSAVLASLISSKATFHSCFLPSQRSKMDVLHLLQVACDEHPLKISVIMSDRIPSFFQKFRMDMDLLGKYAIQIADIGAFKLVLKLVWGHDDMKYFIQFHRKRGFTVGYFDNMCYLSHPNMHESDLSKLDLVVSKDLDRLMKMTKERDEWKTRYEESEARCIALQEESEARCIALQEELRQCQSEIEELRLHATALHMPPLEFTEYEEL